MVHCRCINGEYKGFIYNIFVSRTQEQMFTISDFISLSTSTCDTGDWSPPRDDGQWVLMGCLYRC
jgi:hypothetical protein